MKTILAITLFVAAVSIGGSSRAIAQTSNEAALVKVPFSFIVGDKVLPAGVYQIWSESSDWEMMEIAKAGSTMPIAIVRTWPIPNSAGPASRQVHVQFKNFFGQYFLDWVQLPLMDVHRISIDARKAADTLTKLNLMPAEPVEIAK